MSKERLDKIIYKAERTASLTRPPKPLVTIPDEDFEWLIEQAERSIDYDNKLISIEDNKQYVSELLEQNKRYREALEFYANKINYLIFIENGKSNIEHDQGENARKALEEGTDD